MVAEGTFAGCDRLQSLSLPASVAVLSEHALSNVKSLSSLTFDPGSRLAKIEESAFSCCPCLRSLSLPASLSAIEAKDFFGASIQHIAVDRANPYLFTAGDFLMAFKQMTLIRYFGAGDTAIIPRECESLGDACFARWASPKRIVFADGSRLTRIGDSAFSNCVSLMSLCIPASVESIGELSFESCIAMLQLTFEQGSRLAQIGASAFFECSRLSSICIPPQVQEIRYECFARCHSLSALSFERGSTLTRIDHTALSECRSLRLMEVPAQLKIVELSLLRHCTELSQLRFEVPSQLKDLHLPPAAFRSLSIPDSVEILTGYPQRLKRKNISIYGRIIAVCDVYDALVSRRSFRPAQYPMQAIDMVEQNSDRKFDPDVVDALASIIAPFPTGTVVQLKEGVQGLVVRNFAEDLRHPVLQEFNGKTRSGVTIDLRTDPVYSKMRITKIVEV
jgi:hypothetical protein